MQQRPPHKHHGGLWEFPGGKVETGETPANALIRELAEEIGIDVRIRDIQPVAFAQDRSRDDQFETVILLYTVQNWQGEARALEQGGEIAWFTPAQIEALARPPLDVMLSASLFRSISSKGGGG